MPKPAAKKPAANKPAAKASAAKASAAKAPAAPPFTGFDRSALQFWHELALEMSKDWFVANKPRYEAIWVAPMTALLSHVARRLAPVYRPLALGVPRVLRVYRDVRFAKDKTPYKTHIGAVVRLAGKPAAKIGNAAIYLHFGLDDEHDGEEYVGGGCYQFDAAAMARWRKAVIGKAGDALLAMMAKLRKAGYRVGAYEAYHRVPQGFAADHPRAELLKMKGLTVGFPEIPAGLLHEAAFEDWLVDHARVIAPLVIWLHRHVG